MQNLQETQDREFQEVKIIAAEIATCTTEEDFIGMLDRMKLLVDKVTAIKVYKSVLLQLSNPSASDTLSERVPITFEIDAKFIDTTVQENKEESSKESIDQEYLEEKAAEFNELQESIVSETNKEAEEAERLKLEIEKQNEELRLQEERRKIKEIEKPQQPQEHAKEEQPSSIDTKQEKKFKLAPIKGLTSTVKSLFDDDPLDQINEETEQVIPSPTPSVKISTDYLEAPKKLPDFKLDINDRLAFTKMLFDGSQVELNQMIAKLNAYETLEDAKQYLSDVYYERNWKEADEYAQRLWSLVENKFM